MKRIAGLISVAIMLTTAMASADITVYSGTIYDVVITDPVAVGANPGGEALIGFMVKFVNKTGNSVYDPAGFNGNHPPESQPGNPDAWPGMTDYSGFTGPLHQQEGPLFSIYTPTLDQPLLATNIDTHFNLLVAAVLPAGTGPSETYGLAASTEPNNASPPYDTIAVTSFGDRLYGNFALNGGAATRPVGERDTWQLAWLVVPQSQGYESVYMDLFVSGIGGGEDIEGFMIPEPGTMALLAIGGIGALIRRRR